jgi:hypothetical protein
MLVGTGAVDIVSTFHAICGILVAILGLLQIVLPKVGKRHRLLGRLYLIIWFFVVLTGGFLGSILITLFGVFGFYMALTGFRYAFISRTPDQYLDKAIAIVGVLAVLGILGFAVYLFMLKNSVFGTISVVFGLLFGNTAVKDLRKAFADGTDQTIWLREHLTRMYISYIAAMTAFAVIQNVFNIALLNWLAPTVIGTALIAFERRRRKL